MTAAQSAKARHTAPPNEDLAPNLADEVRTLRAEVERIRLALNICLGILQEDYPDECDGRGAPARNPGRHRDAKAQARAAPRARKGAIVNAAFTPGPWGIATCPRNGDLAIVTPHMNANDGEPAIVAECFEDIRQANEHAKDECNANARLIAAAPDLYAALQDAAKVINGMHMGTLPPCFKPTLELVNAINYALSRAAS